jgi:hypothetical protein
MNKKPQNCWEYWKDSKEKREKCPAYQTDSGRECWLVSSHYCPKIGRDFEYCWDCPWFKKLNPDFEKNRVILKKKSS